MAEHPNVGLIRKGYEAFSGGDLATLSELFTQDIQWHEAGGSGSPLAGDYKGQEAVFEMFGKLVELTGGNFEVRLDECVADDRQAVAVHMANARNGNRTYTSREAIVFHLLEGKVTDAWHTVPDVDAYDAFWSPFESAMEHPNVALMRQGYEAFSTGDVDTLKSRIAADAVCHGPTFGPVAGEYQGIDAILGLFARLMQETDGTLRVDVKDILCNDDWGTVLCTETATRKGTTATIDTVHVHRLRNGQTVELWTATTDPEAEMGLWAD
jgi:ketosteroid isomerase-like protein